MFTVGDLKELPPVYPEAGKRLGSIMKSYLLKLTSVVCLGV